MDLSGLKTIQDYSDRMLRQMDEHGKIYWVPTTVSGFGLYCNKKLLKEHKQKLPENLQEWRQVCSYFKEQGITLLLPIMIYPLRPWQLAGVFIRRIRKTGKMRCSDT